MFATMVERWGLEKVEGVLRAPAAVAVAAQLQQHETSNNSSSGGGSKQQQRARVTHGQPLRMQKHN